MSRKHIPDIFIKEVDLFDSSDVEVGVKITTIIHDTNDKNSWSSKQTSKFMKVLMVISSDPDLNLKISNNEVDFDIDYLKKFYGSNNKVKIFSKPAMSLKKIHHQEEIKFMDSYEVKFDKKEQEIRAFCQVYFETSEMLQSSDLSSSGSKRRRGSISSESIMLNGRLVRSATTFLLPDGQQYNGPVHFHPGVGYMVGPKHTPEKHDVLRTINVVNFKIKDFRKKEYTFPKPNYKENSSLMTKLNYSINMSGFVTGIFSINFKNLILNKTKYGYFLKSLSDQAIQQNIDNIKIKNMEIIRKRIDVDEKAVIVKSFSPFNGSIINEIDNRFSSISEIETNEDTIRMFQFTDKTLNNTSLGVYEYHLSLSFKDPTVDFISNIINDLRLTEKELDDYYTMVNKNKNYDFELDSVKPRLYEAEFDKINPDNYETPIWSRANNVYVKTMSYIYNITSIERIELNFINATKLDPRNSTIFSLRSFKEDFTKLTKHFDNIFQLANEQVQFGSEKTFVKTANSRNIIFIDHHFKESVKLRNYSMSYDYLGINSKGALIIQKDLLQKRLNLENDKFFTRSATGEEAGSVPKESQLLFNFQENYFTYLSPLKISGKNLNINLKNVEEVDVKDINVLFNRSFENNIYKKAERNRKPINANISEEMDSPIEEADPYSNIIETARELMEKIIDRLANSTSEEKQVEDYLNSANYLGDNSLFVRYQNSSDENEIFDTPSPEPSIETAEIYDTPPNINAATPNDYRLSFVGNIISLANKSLEQRNIQDFLLSLPNQIRALFLYSYPFVKKLQGFPDLGIISNLKTQASVNVNYYKLVRIEIFDGYEMSKDGEILMNKPKFAPLKKMHLDSLNKRTMFRLKRYYNNDLKLRRDILSFPVENQYFFVEPTETQEQNITTNDINREVKNITIQHIVSRNYNSNGSTSNIIAQPGDAGIVSKKEQIASVNTIVNVPLPLTSGDDALTPTGPRALQAQVIGTTTTGVTPTRPRALQAQVIGTTTTGVAPPTEQAQVIGTTTTGFTNRGPGTGGNY